MVAVDQRIRGGSIGKSNGLFHRRRAPLCRPSCTTGSYPPVAPAPAGLPGRPLPAPHAAQSGAGAGHPWGKASQTEASKCLCPTHSPTPLSRPIARTPSGSEARWRISKTVWHRLRQSSGGWDCRERPVARQWYHSLVGFSQHISRHAARHEAPDMFIGTPMPPQLFCSLPAACRAGRLRALRRGWRWSR